MPQFLMARAVRLVPALVVMEVVVLAWWLVDGRDFGGAAGQMLASTFYVSNMSMDIEPDGLMRHTWSLATEEQFYLLWPLVLPFVVKARSPWRVLAIAVSASVCARLVLALVGIGAWSYTSLVSNAFGLLLGCLLAIRPIGVSSGRVRRTLPAVCIVVIFGVVWAIPDPASTFLVPIVVAPLAWLMLAVSLPGVAWLEVAWLRFVGRISYALYLWHWPVLVLTGQLMGGVSALPAVVLSCALAAASTIWLEEPLRRRWRARQVAPSRALSQG